jgi:biopolymer transport protein ExbB
MKRSLRPLSAIAQLAPLLGLLGTVYGMITAFQAASSEGVGRGDRLASGIYEALLTTAAGLTVAIPAILVHQILSGRVDRLVDAMDEAGDSLVEEARARARAREARRPGP